jgi:hypothetical protein
MAAPTIELERELDFLDEKHPLFEEMYSTWEQNERRAEGGRAVLDELWRFDWETKYDKALEAAPWYLSAFMPRSEVSVRDVIPITSPFLPGEHYRRRQESAVYTGFMESYAEELVGGLMRESPLPTTGLDFGTLGPVRRKRDIDKPKLSELIYYNADGIGNDGSQWDTFWATQIKAAMHTGYRWILVESPRQAPRLQIRQLQGFRPYLIGFSSRDVTNYHYEEGQLAFACVRFLMRQPKLNTKGKLIGNTMDYGYYWMVRRGYDGFGDAFRGGGWWMYDPQKKFLRSGDWSRTNGEIPLVPLFYDRHPRIFGRPATTMLGNADIALMNVSSAADFDAFDSAGSIQAVRGTTPDGFNLFIEKILGGNRYAPLEGATDDAGKVMSASVQDLSVGAVVADTFEKRINMILRLVDRIKLQETFGTKTSGLSEQAGYIRGNASRLSILAGNVETCQNSVINFLERRAGNANPSGSTYWTRKFQLIELTTAAQSVLQLLRISGLSSVTLESRVVLASATDEGFVPDSQMQETVLAELEESAELKKQLQVQQTQAPQVPGDRKQNMPPEPAQTKQPVKDQLDGPEIP